MFARTPLSAHRHHTALMPRLHHHPIARPIVGLILLSMVSACGGAPRVTETAMAQGAAQTLASGYRLGPGDRVRITVYGQESLSGEFRLDGTGQVAMPLIGLIPAREATAAGLERQIAQRLQEGYVRDPRVNVEVIEFRPFYIVGEVNMPGSYPYATGMTAMGAVALARGYTYRAKHDQVVISRLVDGVRRDMIAAPDTAVLPDDVIRIPERIF